MGTLSLSLVVLAVVSKRLLGRVVLSLATRLPLEHVQRIGVQEALESIQPHYTNEVVNLIRMLLAGPPRQTSVYELCSFLTGRLVGQLDQTYAHADALENELAKQFNAGRMLRVVLKTSLVNGRPEMGMDRHWSETGPFISKTTYKNFLVFFVYLAVSVRFP